MLFPLQKSPGTNSKSTLAKPIRRRPLFLTTLSSLIAAILVPLVCTSASQAETLEEALAAAYGTNPEFFVDCWSQAGAHRHRQ